MTKCSRIKDEGAVGRLTKKERGRNREGLPSIKVFYFKKVLCYYISMEVKNLKVIKISYLSSDHFLLELENSFTKKPNPGQFVHIKIPSLFLRRPYSPLPLWERMKGEGVFWFHVFAPACLCELLFSVAISLKAKRNEKEYYKKSRFYYFCYMG